MSLFVGAISLVLNVLCYILPTLRSENPDNETLKGMYWFIYVLILVANVFTGFG
jgi:multisubunit Na+/H+ antiporter MnhB subunit